MHKHKSRYDMSSSGVTAGANGVYGAVAIIVQPDIAVPLEGRCNSGTCMYGTATAMFGGSFAVSDGVYRSTSI